MSIEVSVQLFCACLLDADNNLYHLIGICEEKDSFDSLAHCGADRNPNGLSTVFEGNRHAPAQNIVNDCISQCDSDSCAASSQSDDFSDRGSDAWPVSPSVIGRSAGLDSSVPKLSHLQGKEVGNDNAFSSIDKYTMDRGNAQNLVANTQRGTKSVPRDEADDLIVWLAFLVNELKVVHHSKNCRKVLSKKFKNGTSFTKWLTDPQPLVKALTQNIFAANCKAKVGMHSCDVDLGRFALNPPPTFSVEITVMGWHASDDDTGVACGLLLLNHREELAGEATASSPALIETASNVASASDEDSSRRAVVVWFDLLGGTHASRTHEIIYCSSNCERVLGVKLEIGMSFMEWLLDRQQFELTVMSVVSAHMDQPSGNGNLNLHLGRFMMRHPTSLVQINLMGWHASDDGNDIRCCTRLQQRQTPISL
eukprot:gnl/MRDRNA2_/MRDRNA2_81057_c0_seq1.p1 gnl/MRDRNA2_/MRDRNA2_81057_c0~~gnl/MRDRNA2_/MRDRNA2_81057_c0_seq1.p1  ORF type:complete len:470 (+),score=59.24 gnl/MRDRNA2_/MRDRNA2_81057_c0_seq1:139-1410(+)